MTTTSNPPVQDPAVVLRAAMVDDLRSEGAVGSEALAAAFAAVPRHLFAPDASLEAAYALHGTVVVKRDASGATLSVMSAAHLQGVMLEQADVRPGMRVLELGSGGYNAALLQELVGPQGQVTTVDIDADVVERASACLSAAGYDRVKVVLTDAEGGVPEGAPYDRIIVTYAAWDIAPAWIAELAQDGTLVVPLRLCGLIRSIAFDREGPGLVSRSYRLARFVPDQGQGAYQERKIMLRDGVALQTDNRDALINAEALNAALDAPRQTFWSGTAFDMADELDLFLTLSLARPAQLYASRQAVDQGVVTAAAILGVPVLVSDNSIAYRTKRPADEPDEFESGVIAFGPQAETLANQYTDLLQRWARDHRRRGAARFRYTPKQSAAAPAPTQDTVIKRHGVVTVSWH